MIPFDMNISPAGFASCNNETTL